MRPKSIVIFDWLYLGQAALTLALSPFTVTQTEDAMRTSPAFVQLGAEFGAVMHAALIAALIIGAAISLLLWYFISRRRSNVAKWIAAALTAYGVLSAINTYVTPGVDMGPVLLTTLPLYALQLAAIYCLFRKDAVAWLEGKAPPVDPNEFN